MKTNKRFNKEEAVDLENLNNWVKDLNNREKERDKIRKDFAFTCLIILTMMFACLAAILLINYTQSLQENQNKLIETTNLQEIEDFNEWKSNFNPFQQNTINKCLATKDTFRKLYCNIEFSKAYNQTISFP